MKLAIVLSHNEKLKGAPLCAPYSHVTEYEFGHVLSSMIQCVAKKRGITCGVFFRDHSGLDNAYKRVKKFGAIGAIELHFKVDESFDVHGTETLFGDIQGSEMFAKCVQDVVCEFLHRRGKENLGVRRLSQGEPGYSNANNGSGIPTILVHPFFGSSSDDTEYVLDLMPDLADAIVDGFLLWKVGDVRKIIPTH